MVLRSHYWLNEPPSPSCTSKSIHLSHLRKFVRKLNIRWPFGNPAWSCLNWALGCIQIAWPTGMKLRWCKNADHLYVNTSLTPPTSLISSLCRLSGLIKLQFTMTSDYRYLTLYTVQAGILNLTLILICMEQINGNSLMWLQSCHSEWKLAQTRSFCIKFCTWKEVERARVISTTSCLCG